MMTWSSSRSVTRTGVPAVRACSSRLRAGIPGSARSSRCRAWRRSNPTSVDFARRTFTYRDRDEHLPHPVGARDELDVCREAGRAERAQDREPAARLRVLGVDSGSSAVAEGDLTRFPARRRACGLRNGAHRAHDHVGAPWVAAGQVLVGHGTSPRRGGTDGSDPRVTGPSPRRGVRSRPGDAAVTLRALTGLHPTPHRAPPCAGPDPRSTR